MHRSIFRHSILFLFVTVATVFSCGFGVHFPGEAPVDSFFFMTATVSKVVEGDTILSVWDTLSELSYYDSTEKVTKVLKMKKPPGYDKMFKTQTPAKIYVTPDSSSLVPTDAPIYLTFYGPGMHVNSSPYRRNETWKVGDRLFLTTAHWYSDTTGTEPEVDIPVFFKRGFCHIKRIYKDDTLYSNVTAHGKLSSDPIIALAQLTIRYKESKDNDEKRDLLKEIQNYGPKQFFIRSDVTYYNYIYSFGFNYSNLVLDSSFKATKKERAQLQYAYAKRWFHIPKEMPRKNRELARHLYYYDSYSNRFLLSTFVKALEKAQFYVPITNVFDPANDDIVEHLINKGHGFEFNDSRLPLFLDEVSAQESNYTPKSVAILNEKEIRKVLKESGNIRSAEINIMDDVKRYSCQRLFSDKRRYDTLEVRRIND